MRSRPIWSRTGALSTTPVAIALPDQWQELKIWVDVPSYARLGASRTPPAVSAVNGVVRLSLHGAPTGGDFALVLFPGDPDAVATALIPYNATASQVQAALVGTGRIDGSDLSASGGPLPGTPVDLTFQGAYAGIVPPLATGHNGLTGGVHPLARLAVTTPPQGNGGYGYLEDAVQEIWSRGSGARQHDRFLYLAAVSGTGVYRVTAAA